VSKARAVGKSQPVGSACLLIVFPDPGTVRDVPRRTNMIYDSVQRLKTYVGISKSLDDAIEYLSHTDIKAFDVGKHPVGGSGLMLNVSSKDSSEPSANRYEVHKKFLDIQIVLEGEERCFYAPINTLAADGAFSDEKDIGFFKDPAGNGVSFPLLPGNFALFFPQDAHKPGCHLNGKKAVRKVVVKVPIV
jgi:biofilm protein TabA